MRVLALPAQKGGSGISCRRATLGADGVLTKGAAPLAIAGPRMPLSPNTARRARWRELADAAFRIPCGAGQPLAHRSAADCTPTRAAARQLLLVGAVAVALAGCQSTRTAEPPSATGEPARHTPAASAGGAGRSSAAVEDGGMRLFGTARQSDPGTRAVQGARRAGGTLVHGAREALGQGDVAAAIGLAELAVRAAPYGATERAMLARAYLAAGRLAAATEAYADLLSLRPGDERARLGRALAHLARGSRDAALADLEQVRNPALVADRGLAYGLAGDTAGAIILLQSAVREASATSRTRQNLALTLALDGQWARARIIAAQDLAPEQVDARVRDWTALAAQRSDARVAALLGITPMADDPGRPAALALGLPVQASGERRAERIVRDATPPAQRAGAERRADAPASAVDLPRQRPAAAVAAAASNRQTGMKQAAPVTSASKPHRVPPAARRAVRTQSAAISRAISAAYKPTAPKLHAAGATPRRWVVQIGAYRTALERDSSWDRLRRSLRSVGARAPIHTSVTVGNGDIYHRLAVGGFDARGAAQSWCDLLRAAGRDCFVRSVDAAASS